MAITNNTEARLAKLKLKQEIESDWIKAGRDVGLAIINNPIMSLVGGIVILELTEKYNITGPIITATAETGVIASATAKALGPALPLLGEAAGKVVSGLVAKK
tara:strand:+ start:213 stop:521 length:309 start_codon:yes stop_codon:yes gene_type:complete